MSANDPIPIGFTPGQDVTLDHLQDQIEWYDRKSGSNQNAFKYLKSCTISAAVIIPVLTKTEGMSSAAAGLGVFIVILEGLQQLNQYHSNCPPFNLRHPGTRELSLSRKSGRLRYSQQSTVLLASGSNLWFPSNTQNGLRARNTKGKGSTLLVAQ